MRHLNASIMLRNRHTERLLNALIWCCLTIGLAFLLVLATAFKAQAQWPINPANPLPICNDASSQKNLGIVSDGQGGYITLWTDNRLAADRYAIFGQRITAQGDLLWESNGRLLREVPGRSINTYGAARMSNNNFMIAYSSGLGQFTADTLYAMAFDVDGQPVWAQPTLLAQPGMLPGTGTANGHWYPRMAQVLNGIFIGWGTNPIGAADYVHIARVLNDGTNLMPVQGVEVTTMNNSIVTGPWTFRHDLNGGLMLEERWGNGSGAPLYAMRVDSMGAQLWPALLQVSANSMGLSYEWTTAVAPTSRVNSIWGYGYDLRMSIYDTTGVLQNSGAPIDVCIHPDVQENPFVVQTADESTVFWSDNRTSAGNGRQVFMQRFDAQGNALLTANGVLAMQMNGNLIGFPRAIAVGGGTHIVTMFSGVDQLGGTGGFRAGRITNTGTNLWSDTTIFAIPSKGPNGGSAYGIVPDGSGGAIAVWFNWEDDAIYTARIASDGRLGPDDNTAIAERDGDDALRAYPNPANDQVTIAFDTPFAGGSAVVELIDATGRTIRAERIAAYSASHTMALSPELADGLYQVVIKIPGATPRSARVMVER